MHHFLIGTLLFLTLIGCQKGPTLGPGDQDQLASAAEVDCGFIQNSYGQRVSWKKNIPVIIKIHKDFPPEHESALTNAVQHWNDAAGMTLLQIEQEREVASEKARSDSINSIYWMRDWPETQKGLQGLTNLNWRDSQIYESDVSIDNKYFNYFTDTPTTTYDIHLESLLIHELGHVLGLKHRSNVPSVMWSVLNGSIKRDSLTAADRETIKCEY